MESPHGHDMNQDETKDRSDRKERHHKRREGAGSPSQGEDLSSSTPGKPHKSKSRRRKHHHASPDDQVGLGSPLSISSGTSDSRGTGSAWSTPQAFVSPDQQKDATEAATGSAKDKAASLIQRQQPAERQEPHLTTEPLEQEGPQQEKTAGQAAQASHRREPQHQNQTPPAGQEVQPTGRWEQEPRKLEGGEDSHVIPPHWKQEARTDISREPQPRPQQVMKPVGAARLGARPEGQVKAGRKSSRQTPRELSLFPSPMAIVVVFLMALFGVPLSVLVFKAFPRTDTQCVSRACVEVLDYMDAIVDKSVAPCHDFYRHVCGHWLRDESSPTPAPPPSSFMADVLRNYTALRHRKMMPRRQWKKPADYVSQYYRRCVAYLFEMRSLQKILDELFKVTDIKPHLWLNMTPDEEFTHLLRLSYVYRVHGLVNVTLAKDGNHILFEVHMVTSFNGRFQNIGKDSSSGPYLESVLKAIGHDEVNDTIIKECLSLDDDIAHLENYGSSPLPIPTNECADFPPQKWIAVTNSFEGMENLPGDTKVIAARYNDTCRNLGSVLLSQVPQVRAFYPIALLAANFLKLDFMITSGSKHDAKLVREVCHADTWTTFGFLFADALTKVLSLSPKAAQTVETYFSALKAVIAEEARVLGIWMTEEDGRATISRAKALQVSHFGNHSFRSENEVAGTRFDATFSMRENNWIYNKVNVMKRTRVADDVDSFSRTSVFARGNVGRYDTELDSDVKLNLVFVPHMFALPPVFFDELSGASYANIAILGVQMARQTLRLLVNGVVASASWSKQTMTAYEELKKCYVNSSFSFHGQLDDEQFGDAIAAALAIRYAFLSRMNMTVASDDRFSSKQLFFRRACLSLCAGGKQRADFNSLDRDAASASCTLGVSSMPAFHETFGCTDVDPMALPRVCKL